MLYSIKNKIKNNDLLRGNYGIERESLRINRNGRLSTTIHPKSLGGKMSNPYITTDFSESQVELITPVCNSVEEVYDFLSNLYDIVSLEINDEYLWPQSMPCDIPEEDNIPIAEFCTCKEEGRKAREYREMLFKKYGGKKQLISGIHYNFSYNENIIKALYAEQNNAITYREFRDKVYLKVARNYLKYRWLLIYLFGGAAIIHRSYKCESQKHLEEIYENTFTNKSVLSFRNGECGYGNIIELFPTYESVEKYVESIKGFINEGLIDSHRELYTQLRLKGLDNNDLLESLYKDGINYLEIRSIDINPFDKTGISLMDLRFLNIFMLYLLNLDEEVYENWQEEAWYNQKKIADYGQGNVSLRRNGEDIEKISWGEIILEEIKNINDDFGLGYEEVIEYQLKKIKDSELTYANRIKELAKSDGYINCNLELAKKYKDDAFKNRYKLRGYENLELSTQILLRAAIKRGLGMEVLDKNDNFIMLSKKNKKEYIKQATKTSRDNYVTVLIMENKSVTKKVLNDNGIIVPKGKELYSTEESLNNISEYINKPIVIKPKSTNFGLGITIFTEKANIEDIYSAIELAFQYDNTVLIEEFIKGKEYRFLVIGDKVQGILHRVPANVKGDGIRSIEELVIEKNKDSLRGKGYKTPLEKIVLDKQSELFLKQRGMNFKYIPKKNEVVYLRENSNISTGGDSIDYTDVIPDRFKEIAVKSSKAVNAEICGVDMIIEDIEDDMSNYSIIELNFNPAIHIHCYPYKGQERNIADEILNLLEFNNEYC